ncbi:hypothetical protein ABIE26_003601 [Pedobacter africanus]
MGGVIEGGMINTTVNSGCISRVSWLEDQKCEEIAAANYLKIHRCGTNYSCFVVLTNVMK